jgi:hypothetical protein
MDIRITLTGKTPLMQHNIRLADPLDEWTKALKAANAKRNKTEEDHREVQRIEWYGGIYFDPEIGVYVPSSWIAQSLRGGGSLYGKKGTTVGRALIMDEERIPLAFSGPRMDLDKLWDSGEFRDTRAVGVQRAKVARTRPIFRNWALETTAYLDTNELDLEVLQEIADKAGALVGIGDYRPAKQGIYGRFAAEVDKA